MARSCAVWWCGVRSGRVRLTGLDRIGMVGFGTVGFGGAWIG